MCMFCAAIPAAAAIGVTIDNKQAQGLRRPHNLADQPARPRPILKMTACIIALLLVASFTYHAIRYGP